MVHASFDHGVQFDSKPMARARTAAAQILRFSGLPAIFRAIGGSIASRYVGAVKTIAKRIKMFIESSPLVVIAKSRSGAVLRKASISSPASRRRSGSPPVIESFGFPAAKGFDGLLISS